MARILVLTNLYPPHHYGGYELACRATVERWRARGHAVDVVASGHQRTGVRADAEVGVTRGLHFYWEDHDILEPPLRLRLDWERHNHHLWKGALNSFRPDVVSVWNFGAMSYPLLDEVVRRDVPLVLVIADNWLNWGPAYDMWTRMFVDHGPLVRLAGRAVRAATGIATSYPDLGRAAVALFASKWLQDEARRVSRFRFDREAVVPWGIDTDVVPVVAPTPRQFEWRVVLVGRMDPRKGVLSAVRALAEVPEAALTLVGPGDAAERAAVEALVDELGLRDRVSLRETDQAGVVAEYRRADIALFPSEWAEPFGLVGLEAMACGVPLIATGTGGSGEYLEHERNALLVPPADPPAMAAAIRRLAGDPALRQRLVEAGQHTAATFTLTHMADQLESSHLEAMKPRSTRPG